MRIKHLELFIAQLEEAKCFYVDKFGFDLQDENENGFTIDVGWSKLTFKRNDEPYLYHYCFLIPSNKLDDALEWVSSRTEIIEIEPGRKIQFFDTWNARSFYFLDASGNLAEMIVRYELQNETSVPFDVNQVLCVNEIGIPTTNISDVNAGLEHELGSHFWKGDYKRFGTHGDLEGLLLLPNPEHKNVWFPTQIPIQSSSLDLLAEVNDTEYFIQYNGDLKP